MEELRSVNPISWTAYHSQNFEKTEQKLNFIKNRKKSLDETGHLRITLKTIRKGFSRGKTIEKDTNKYYIMTNIVFIQHII